MTLDPSFEFYDIFDMFGITQEEDTEAEGPLVLRMVLDNYVYIGININIC